MSLECGICLQMFSAPVTISCGHTFCKFCLIESQGSNPFLVCSYCKNQTISINQTQSEDQVIKKLVELESNKSKQTIQNNDHQLKRMLLLDVRSDQLLLPFTKIVGTFQLQDRHLIKKLNNFVVRQAEPFGKFGVVSKVKKLKQLGHQIYQCTIEGKAFCTILNERVQTDIREEFFYRLCECQVKQQNKQLISQHFKSLLQEFVQKFKKINNRSALEQIYNQISIENLQNFQDPIPCFYSILKIMAQPIQMKYDIAISFDNQKRQKFLKQFLKKDLNIEKQYDKFIQINKSGPFTYFFYSFLFGILIYVLLRLFL